MKWLNPKHEKIPKDKYVIVTIKDSNSKVNFITFGYRVSEDSFFDTDIFNDGVHPYHIDIKNIIAWMDLPEASVGFIL